MELLDADLLLDSSPVGFGVFVPDLDGSEDGVLNPEAELCAEVV